MSEIPTISLKLLRPHPSQAVYYGDCSPSDDKSLMADLRQRGQRDPIIVMPAQNAAGLPAYTILDGHRRARLLAQLEVTEARVVIREDLKDADAAVVEAEFLKYNFMRRQLHLLDKARIAERLFEIEKKRPPGSLHRSDEREARDRVGKAIGMSGRNLNRYWLILKALLAIQNAFRERRLTLVMAARIATLPADAQAEIAQHIESGMAPKQLKELLGEHITTKRNAVRAVARYLRALDRCGCEVRELSGRVPAGVFAAHLPQLQSGRALLEDLIAIAEKAPAPPSAAEMMAKLQSLGLEV